MFCMSDFSLSMKPPRACGPRAHDPQVKKLSPFFTKGTKNDILYAPFPWSSAGLLYIERLRRRA
jgi:hypothetical protein